MLNREAGAVSMPSPILKLGAITIMSLSDGVFAMPAARILPSVTDEQWQPLKQHLNADGTVPLNLGSFLIEEGGAWTLVDAGFGNRPNSPGGRLLGELEKAKVSPDQVTQPEVKQSQPIIDLCAEPLAAAGLLDLIDGDQTLSPGIATLFTPGHTPGHQSVLVSSGNERAVILGDVSHTPAQVTHPEWSPVFDDDAAQSARTRAALWERIEQQGLTVCAGHYAYPGFGGIVRVEGKRVWQGA